MSFDPTSAPFSSAPPAPGLMDLPDPSVAGEGSPAPPPGPAPSAPAPAGGFDLLADVEIEVTVEFGRRRMPLGEVARLEVGSVIELDALAGEPLAIFANGRRIATGEAVVVDGQFAVRIASLAR